VRLLVDRVPDPDLPPHAHLHALAPGAFGYTTAAQAVRDHAGHLSCAAGTDQFPIPSIEIAGAR